MAKPVLARFRAADLTEMIMEEHATARLKALGPLEATAKGLERAGPAWTLRIGGEIIGCSGVVILWPGVGEAWAFQSVLAPAYPVAAFRALRQGLLAIIEERGLRRVQAVVHEDIPLSERWVERLGFRPEGEMRRYGPDGDTYIRYSLLPGGNSHG